MSQEAEDFQKDCKVRQGRLSNAQKEEIQNFDLHTVTMGLDAVRIAEISQETFDDMSIRGSSLSLTSSASGSTAYLSGIGSTPGGNGANNLHLLQRNSHQLPPHNTAL